MRSGLQNGEFHVIVGSALVRARLSITVLFAFSIAFAAKCVLFTVNRMYPNSSA